MAEPDQLELEAWLEKALSPPRAWGPPVSRGILRAEAADFTVEEELGFAPAGTGQHVLLKVRKRNANTQWVARELARIARCKPVDVGYAGLKDRRAVATQWFSVPRSVMAVEAWAGVQEAEFEVLEAHAHSRKLPRGALQANRFSIRVREVNAVGSQLQDRIAALVRGGVPNYFGPQRFGRDGANLRALHARSRDLRQRGFVLSAARGLVFNHVLAERLRQSSWDRLEVGDLAILDGRGSFFPVELLDANLSERCARLEIHPSGPLWGIGPPPSHGRIRDLEVHCAADLTPVTQLIEAAGMKQERRSLRAALSEVHYSSEGSDVLLRFRLARGSFATAVLREIFDVDPSGSTLGSLEE